MNQEKIEIHFSKVKTLGVICLPFLLLVFYVFVFQEIMKSRIDVIIAVGGVTGILMLLVILPAIALFGKWITGKPALVIRPDGLFDYVHSGSLIEWANISGVETTMVGNGMPLIEPTNRFEKWFQAPYKQLSLKLHHPEAVFKQQTQFLKILQLKITALSYGTPVVIPTFHLGISLNELQILILRKMRDNKALQNNSNIPITNSADMFLAFTLEETDYLNSYLYFFLRSQSLVLLSRFLTTLLISIAFGSILSFVFPHKPAFILVACLFVVFASLLLLPKPFEWVVLFVKKIAKMGFQAAHRYPQYLGQQSDSHLKIMNDCIEIRTHTGEIQSVPVEQIRVIHETSNYYFFELITNNRLVIPKSKVENGAALKIKIDNFINKFNILYVKNTN